jgi:hypothetical protein
MYYGETECSGVTRKGTPCTNRAYYSVDDRYFCGVHSKKGERTELKRDPNAKRKAAQELADMRTSIDRAAAENSCAGSVMVSKLGFMKKPKYVGSTLCVFPNYKHQNRADGFGCASLSPKALGPVDHGMPGIPPARSIENYHQFAKVFPSEADEDGEPLEGVLEERIKGYTSRIPMRHKPAAKGKNIPLYSLYYDKDGNPHKYTYLQCRYFYCHWYERLVKDNPDLAHLYDLINRGYSLNIVGYDGYEVSGDLYEHYKDTTRPFGHELVLYTILTVPCPKDYPWNMYYRRHKKIYEGVI